MADKPTLKRLTPGRLAATCFLTAALYIAPCAADTLYFFGEAVADEQIRKQDNGTYTFHPYPESPQIEHSYRLPADTRFHKLPNGGTQIWVTDKDAAHPQAGIMFEAPQSPFTDSPATDTGTDDLYHPGDIVTFPIKPKLP